MHIQTSVTCEHRAGSHTCMNTRQGWYSVFQCTDHTWWRIITNFSAKLGWPNSWATASKSAWERESQLTTREILQGILHHCITWSSCALHVNTAAYLQHWSATWHNAFVFMNTFTLHNQMCSALEINALISGDKHVYLQGWMCLSPVKNLCKMQNVFYLVADQYCTCKWVPVAQCMQQHVHSTCLFPPAPHFCDKASCQKEVEWGGRATYELWHKLTTNGVCLDDSDVEKRKKGWVGEKKDEGREKRWRERPMTYNILVCVLEKHTRFMLHVHVHSWLTQICYMHCETTQCM